MHITGDNAGMETAFWDHLLNNEEFSVQYAADVPGSGRVGSVVYCVLGLAV